MPIVIELFGVIRNWLELTPPEEKNVHSDSIVIGAKNSISQLECFSQK